MNNLKNILNKIKADPFGDLLVGALAGGFIVLGIIEFVLEYAISLHWGLGILIILIAGVSLVWVSKQTKHFNKTNYPISLVTFYMLISVVLGAMFFASISYLLFREQEIAIYKSTIKPNFMVFRNFYFWTFLDLIPVIDLWKVIPLKPQIEPISAISGVPILLFRLYIIGVVFSSIRIWWKLNIK